MYIHTQSLTNDDMWDFMNDLSERDERQYLIVGDFNARSREQGNKTENRKGIALSQALLSSNKTCLNDRRPKILASRPGDRDGVIRFGADLNY